MKFNTCVLGGLSLALASQAQTTAFTYQGQLNNSNAPVTGVYDFQFQIYNASSVVAGPLTNSPVGVTNGSFTVTLDFGADVFDGDSRSLEIGVRRYGETNAYAVLAPRQPLSSVPYAIRSLTASNAGALTAPLPATNLAGTIPNSLLSPDVALLTNSVNFSGDVSAASFTGDGSGLANIPLTSLQSGGAAVQQVLAFDGTSWGPASVNATIVNQSVVTASLSDDVWLKLQASAIPANKNWKYGGQTNSYNKIQSHSQFKIQLDGTGLIAFGLLDGAWSNLLSVLPLAGYLNGFASGGPGTYHPVGGPAIVSNGKDGYWFLPYVGTTNVNGTNETWNPYWPKWNVFRVDCVVGPDGSSFQLQTNRGYDGDNQWGDAPNGLFSTVNATLGARSFYWTNQFGPMDIEVRYVSKSAGTNRFLSQGCWDSTITNGMIVGMQNQFSSHPADEVAVSNVIMTAVYSNWSPDLILWQSPEGTNRMDLLTPLTNWIAEYQQACPQADIVLCGMYPSLYDYTGVSGGPITNSQTAVNKIYFGYAQQYNVAYFDAETPFVDYATWNARGFAAYDGVHPTVPGCTAYSYLLSRFLGLNDIVGSSGTISGGVAVGNGSGLTNLNANALVNGSTNYYPHVTNGVVTFTTSP